MKFAAIIFDMDGLLVDSEPLWHEAERAMIEACGYRYAADIRDQTIGLRADEFARIIHQHYPRVGATPAAITQNLEGRVLRMTREQIKPRPGAEEIVRYAAERHIPRAIASSSSQAIIEHFTRLLGWGDLLPQRYSAQLVARGKPAPDIYLYAADQIRVTPENCLALEDSAAGTRAAIAAGMTCCTVPDLSHTRLEDFAGINHLLFDSLHDVLRELQGGGQFA